MDEKTFQHCIVALSELARAIRKVSRSWTIRWAVGA